MTMMRGRPMSAVEDQRDLMRSHVTRGVPVATKTDGGRTPRLAVPPGWAAEALCLNNWEYYDDPTGLKDGQAAARCEGCPVLAQCLEAALAEEHGLSAGSRYGIRGGLSPKERAEKAFAERACERGHRGQWGSHQNTNLSVCLECLREDARARYAERVADEDFRQARNARIRESRSIRRVSCVECRTEMRTTNLGRHLGRCVKQQEAA